MSRVSGSLARRRNKKRCRFATVIAPSKHPKKSRVYIDMFHRLQKVLERAKADNDDTAIQRAEAELAEIGGLEIYQDASITGHSQKHRFNSAKWIIKCLDGEGSSPIQLLDVGALTNHYLPFSRINATAIDLNPRHSSVQKADFFEYCPEPSEGGVLFDAVVLSLVLNFVGCKRMRGEMLRRAASLLLPSGLLFVVLPRACTENSRYLTPQILESCMRSLGLRVEPDLCRSSPKLAMFVYRRHLSSLPTSIEMERFTFTPKIVRSGSGRNNFSIAFE